MRSFRKFLLAIISIILFMGIYTYSNPILLTFFSELLVDHQNPYNWKLEIRCESQESLDGWYLTSLTDTAYFKEGMKTDYETFLVVTQDSLLDSFAINPIGDWISLVDSFDGNWETIRFGNVEYAEISAPLPGQSISRVERDKGYAWYLDNTPTIGIINDLENGEGWIDGYVYDDELKPVADAKVQYGWEEIMWNYYVPLLVMSDSTGYFTFKNIAKIANLNASKTGYISTDTLLQIWPDSTLSIDFMLIDTVLVGIRDEELEIVKNFGLTQNYPNPFNSKTTIKFSLPLSDFVELSIYDMSGRKLETLVSKYLQSGDYTISWNADNVASGVYLYQLVTSLSTDSRKCLLIK